jgi:hypothetical protein
MVYGHGDRGSDPFGVRALVADGRDAESAPKDISRGGRAGRASGCDDQASVAGVSKAWRILAVDVDRRMTMGPDPRLRPASLGVAHMFTETTGRGCEARRT